jgi:hypothetical protein
MKLGNLIGAHIGIRFKDTPNEVLTPAVLLDLETAGIWVSGAEFSDRFTYQMNEIAGRKQADNSQRPVCFIPYSSIQCIVASAHAQTPSQPE